MRQPYISLRARGLLLILVSAGVSPNIAAAVEFPEFTRQDLVVDPQPLVGPPRNYPWADAIFPSIIDAQAHFAKPLANYYLYYGPHDSPGGIYLAHSDSLNGPWTLYDADANDPDLDPVITNNVPGEYEVTHVASPHALWIPEEKKMFLWYHGENTTTRYASTVDGIYFHHEDVAVDSSHFNGTWEAAYAKVFRCAAPERNANYVMLLMGNQAGTRPIYIAWSRDARRWHTERDPFIVPSAPREHNPQVSSPVLFEWAGAKYVVYHQDSLAFPGPPGHMWATPITNNFEVAGPAELFFEANQAEDRGRVASPFFMRKGGKLHLFYDSGVRLQNSIRHATAPLPGSQSEIVDWRQGNSTASSAVEALPLLTDADSHTGWTPGTDHKQWICIDLGTERLLKEVTVDWVNAFGDYSLYAALGQTAPNPTTELDKWDMIASVRGDQSANDLNGIAENDRTSGSQSHSFDLVAGEFRGDLTANMRATVVDNWSGLRARYLLLYLPRVANRLTKVGGFTVSHLVAAEADRADPRPSK